MDDGKEFYESELSKEVEIGQIKLTIIARHREKEGWELFVVNDYGVSTNWNECFQSAQEAINEALRAINEEGVEDFMGYEYFGYLYENKNV